MTVAFLLVTCCLEPSRSQILADVISNLHQQAPNIGPQLTVFDNASTEVGTIDVLQDSFEVVYRADRNVGYWTAIDWWLRSLEDDPPEFTYIIESDMIHYAFDKVWTCADYLRGHPEVGAVRLHEYSVHDRHLYNKDVPVAGSKRNIWQSHTNKATGKPVKLVQAEAPFQDIWRANFLTQLPALNRYATMKQVFNHLRNTPKFSELDFQTIYHASHPTNAILDGGIFHCDPGSYGAPTVTGSWTSEAELKRIGYHSTRYASITPAGQYTVTRLR